MPKNLVLPAQLRNKIERGVDDSSPIRTAAVMTCVAEPQPSDAFRRGRDAGCPAPPAQIPASGITALGSYLG